MLRTLVVPLVAFAVPGIARLKTEVPAAVPGAKPVTVERIKVPRPALEGYSGSQRPLTATSSCFCRLPTRRTSSGGIRSCSLTRMFGGPRLAQNYLNRVLKPAAVRAEIGVFPRRTRKGDEVESTDVNFQVLRRTCATLFGSKAKDPRDTQAQLRHADPAVTLRHYPKSIPAIVRAAAVALEEELIGASVNRFERVLNRPDFDAELQLLENAGATRRD